MLWVLDVWAKGEGLAHRVRWLITRRRRREHAALRAALRDLLPGAAEALGGAGMRARPHIKRAAVLCALIDAPGANEEANAGSGAADNSGVVQSSGAAVDGGEGDGAGRLWGGSAEAVAAGKEDVQAVGAGVEAAKRLHHAVWLLDQEVCGARLCL